MGANEELAKLNENKLMELYHATATGGHFGIHATYHRLASVLHWKGMHHQVRQFILACDTCQRNKHETVAYPGGKSVILVVTDRPSQLAHFMALRYPYKTMMNLMSGQAFGTEEHRVLFGSINYIRDDATEEYEGQLFW
ncbi:hypothetical protein ACH5RR_001192 [Cinchona calisaya]|uniref:Integrase zinc-binding domain-containing protein n=1 Tax=Cinchona calisaya TaxID=153742 RepID=A0ABD3B2Z7_9GENT